MKSKAYKNALKTKLKVWRFCAYKSEQDYDNGNHFFMKDFTDHTEMKTFSADHSYENKKLYPDYCSMYWNLDYRAFQTPNINFQLHDMDDEREIEYFQDHIKKRGFCDSELWSLDHAIVNFILPRLERFQEIDPTCPKVHAKFKKDIKHVIKAFKLYQKDDIYNEKDQKIIDKGLEKFAKIFRGLWI